jgi:hypothetical protein
LGNTSRFQPKILYESAIGKWKDGAKTERQWKLNVASVAYRIWMEAAQELPKCPEGSAMAAFLDDWSGRTYTDVFEKKGPVEKHFGLARATTLLHFVSGGRFPIFDSRVRTAIARLRDDHVPPNTVFAGTWIHSAHSSRSSPLSARRRAIRAYWTRHSSATVRRKSFHSQTDPLPRRQLLLLPHPRRGAISL